MIFAISSKSKRGERGNSTLGSPWPRLHRKLDLTLGTGEEFAIDAFIVEARHRPAIESERARRHDQIGPLQSAVAEGGVEDLLLVALEPALGVGMGKELGQMLRSRDRSR